MIARKIGARSAPEPVSQLYTEHDDVTNPLQPRKDAEGSDNSEPHSAKTPKAPTTPT